ncbi:lipid-A-disaccharide synthase [Pseudolysobacter antarcticus]|uniref:Lipid-A-disaccharide synthase n=1 Tax=Pseudolysobacter antarcticus TaxID=2511995 RepID=A0A411HM47_9GAMM|nr:lipid-A-disaccharide synthase [Pseudolysobacter antarcticus]QBB71484.1 lipid-A-disaccharide synthase [Pseudolysobacter antarcticus]
MIAASTSNALISNRPRCFALVAGEASGDLLGAGLICALRQRHPDARFVGIGGPLMIAAGMESWHALEKLSVMGYVEVLRHLPKLLAIRRDIKRRVLALRPDCFVGIDAPDFNLGLERTFKQAGIRTVHYVSPSIWWREKRAQKMGRHADLVLCLFPMEPPIYARHGVNARFVGHPLADQFALEPDRAAARTTLNLPADVPVLALLPGSRLGEIQRLGPEFIAAARLCQKQLPALQVIAPMANAACRELFANLLAQDHAEVSIAIDSAAENSPAPIRLLDGHAHAAMIAADAVLLASGTAALEAMLAKRPMVVGYRLASLTYRIVTTLGLLKTQHYALPNILAGGALVPELMQEQCTAQNLADALLPALHVRNTPTALIAEFTRLHRELQLDADQTAAAAIDELLQTPTQH